MPRSPRNPTVNDPGDIDGVSVSREELSELDQIRTARTTGKIGHVVAVAVRTIRSEELSLEKKPLSDDPGHCVIPELNSKDYRGTRKHWILEKAAALAKSSELVYEAPAA
ncbi:MAG: hypothetical protein AAGC44_10460 [Planctomycetota bacterium]